ncbi:MAG TPA: hypothetical protein VMR48_01975 [Gaiellaceae bacterium]|jgi:hypothetical protein|nr:hypothetical protein [Gaiellaceae bacterium]
MYYSPHSHLAIARARQEDMLRDAERARLARRFEDERPGVFTRLWTHVSRKREPSARPITA